MRSPKAGPIPEVELTELLRDCDAVIASSDPYTAAMFAGLPGFKMVARCGVGYDRVRGSGVFNERHEVDFGSPRLIVVGVAADRRQIIRQARARGLDVIVVNPCKKVSPNVTQLDYLRFNDIFFKCEAQQFFGDVLGRHGNA